jgi:hypothetical protein
VRFCRAIHANGDRPVIRNRREHEAFLRRNGYEEVGNDKSMAPKSNEEIAHRQAQYAADDAPVVSEADLIREGWISEPLESDNG